jgi:uncharacterized membrane protein YqjE
MVNQATVRPGAPARGNDEGNGQGVVGSIAELGNDIATLAELQAKLAALDLKESTRRVVAPLVAISVGLALALGCIPVALIGVAFLLMEVLNLTTGWAMLLTAALALVAAAIVAALAAMALRSSFEPFRRSREELTRNIAWVRTVLVHSGRASPRRGF